MSKPYSNVLNRARTLHINIDRMIGRIEELEKSNDKLREELKSSAAREHARERVMEQMSKAINWETLDTEIMEWKRDVDK